MLRSSPFQQVTGEGEGAARKADQRRCPGQLRPGHLDCLQEIRQVLLGVDGLKGVDIATRPEGAVERRALRIVKVQTNAHFFKGEKDIGEDYGGVQIESPDGLEGDLDG